MVIGELYRERAEIAPVLAAHPLHQGLRRLAPLPGLEHDGRAVRVVGANIVAPTPAQALVARPDIRLHGFEQMPEMQRTVGVRQGAGDENRFQRNQ